MARTRSGIPSVIRKCSSNEWAGFQLKMKASLCMACDDEQETLQTAGDTCDRWHTMQLLGLVLQLRPDIHLSMRHNDPHSTQLNPKPWTLNLTSYCKSCISFYQRLSPCIGPFCEATCTLTWWLWQLQQDCLETQHLYPVKVKFKTDFTYTSAVGAAAATLVAGLLASSSLVSPSKVCWPIATSVLNVKQPFWFSMLTVRKKCSSSELALSNCQQAKVCLWMVTFQKKWHMRLMTSSCCLSEVLPYFVMTAWQLLPFTCSLSLGGSLVDCSLCMLHAVARWPSAPGQSTFYAQENLYH